MSIFVDQPGNFTTLYDFNDVLMWYLQPVATGGGVTDNLKVCSCATVTVNPSGLLTAAHTAAIESSLLKAG